jgi:hypothetical protein
MKLTGHAERMLEKKNAYRLLIENLKEIDHQEHLEVGDIFVHNM